MGKFILNTTIYSGHPAVSPCVDISIPCKSFYYLICQKLLSVNKCIFEELALSFKCLSRISGVFHKCDFLGDEPSEV